jgi:steroid delta-isomerase-like uncharacterized protein
MSGAGPAAGAAADWARAYRDAWNAHDSAAVISFWADDGVHQDLALGGRFEGAAAVRAFVDGMETTFSTDYRFEPGTVVGDGEGYALEWTMVGTNDRADPEHGLPATGRSYRVPGVSVGRVRDGRIVENRDYWNLADFLQQVGLMPRPEDAITTSG